MVLYLDVPLEVQRDDAHATSRRRAHIDIGVAVGGELGDTGGLGSVVGSIRGGILGDNP